MMGMWRETPSHLRGGTEGLRVADLKDSQLPSASWRERQRRNFPGHDAHLRAVSAGDIVVWTPSWWPELLDPSGEKFHLHWF